MKFIFFFSVLLMPSIGAALINGRALENTPDLVRLVFKNHWVCSGSFLNETTILTAAHCIAAVHENEQILLDQVLSDNDEPINIVQIKSFAHPDFKGQAWPAHDLGIIKTTPNRRFKGNFKLEMRLNKRTGTAVLFGCGKTAVTKETRSRTFGDNNFLRMGSVLFFVGKSKYSESDSGAHVSVAPNDSGAPITDKATGNVIGISTTTTAKGSWEYGLPALSTGTSTVISSNLAFILSHLDPIDK